MLALHESDNLAALLDGQLEPRAAERVRRHLEECGPCATELDEIRFGISMVERLPLAAPPEQLWRSIEAALESPARPRPLWRVALAAAATLLIAAVLLSLVRQPARQWEVTRIAGTAVVGSRPLERAVRAGAGSRIATGADGRAQIRIGEIGTVVLNPDSDLRLLELDPRHHRLALRSGSLAASITAPPRLFFVETPSATAIDLGCEYTLECDREGNGLLNVTAGWVAFEWHGRESLVPAGASCRTRPRIGPGTPYFADAPAPLLVALDEFDLRGASSHVLGTLLREARTRDTLTLWHLLARVALPQREAVFERMAALAPPPPDVTREHALRLDPAALTRWREELAWTW